MDLNNVAPRDVRTNNTFALVPLGQYLNNMSWENTTNVSINIEYLATEALDFLMTQDGDYLITNQSTFWSKVLNTIIGWTNSGGLDPKNIWQKN